MRAVMLAVATTSLGFAVATAAAPQVFRTATQHVSVSAIVVDKDGRPVHGLTKDDFVLTTNNQTQKIADFSEVSIPDPHRVVDLDAPTPPPSDVAANAETAEASRAFVFVIADIPATELVPLKRLMKSVLTTVTPQDQVAFVYTARSDISQDFTNDLGRLIDAANFRRDAIGAGDFTPTRSLMISLRNVVSTLASSHHARRSVFLVGTAGCNPERDSECRDLVKAANRSDVSFYVLDPRLFPYAGSDSMAIASTQDRTAAITLRSDDRNSMMSLAALTGGRAMSGAADPAAEAASIVLENNNYYLLGFYPDPIATDGKFHEINVKVNRPDVFVRARQGYMAPDSRPIKPMTVTREMTGQLAAGLDDPGLPIRAFAAPLSEAPHGKTRTLVTVEIAYPAPTDGNRTLDDDVRVGILALTPDSKIKASFQRPIKITGKWLDTAKGKLVINETIDLPQEQLALRIGVTSRALGKSGTTHLKVNPPDFDDKEIQLSGLVIGADSAVIDATMGLGSLKGIVPFQPTTNRTFASTDALHVYSRATWGTSAAPASMRIGVLGRWGIAPREIQVAGHLNSNKRYVGELDTKVPLASLGPGDYVLRVDAMQSGKSSTREIPFSVR